jgi:seryl-tRNA synthetase
MIDINLLRSEPDRVKENLGRRHDPRVLALLDQVVTWDQDWRRSLLEINELRHRRNVVSREVGERKRRGEDAGALLQEASDISRRIEELEGRVDELEARTRDGLMRLPNLLHDSVPPGRDASENSEVRRWGKPREFDFPLKAHGELLESLDLVDFERGRKVAGAGFNYLKGAGALLDQALVRFALDFLVKKGYTPLMVPEMLLRAPYEGMVDLSAFEEVMYRVVGEELYLIATSEHPIGAMYMDEVLEEESLPLRYAGVSVNFRKEIGAHGVDTKGLFRMHQFNKVEQFAFATPEQSWDIHEEIIANAEGLYRKLKIPHRVITLCSGDTGRVMAKTYDLEAWSPRQGKYVEVGSISNAADYQARRLRIRTGKMGGAKRVAHTLNGTAIATSRAMVAIVENYQNEAGGFEVPEALRPYMGGIRSVGPTPRAAKRRAAGAGKRRAK